MSDLFPTETVRWQSLEQSARDIFSQYGYGEIRTPLLERTDVFLRSIGQETDIVQKEMYTFNDRGGRSLTLRPEGTASVLRALANAGISQGESLRVYYMGPMFRGERPAAGRKRQFHQIGAENVGRVSPHADVECIAMLLHFLREIGVCDTALLVNSRGDRYDRDAISTALKAYFDGHIARMCEDCSRRYRTNLWRILDCKSDACSEIIAGAPSIVDQLGTGSQAYFRTVCDGLSRLGLDYVVDPRLVRGLDYYAHTVFEITSTGLGAQNAVAGGGRYEITMPGAKHAVPGVGFALGIERLLMAGASSQAFLPDVDAYLIGIGDEALTANLALAASLREAGASVLAETENRGLKAQLRAANKYDVRYALIRGDDEIDRGVVQVKNMKIAAQSEVSATDVDALLAILADDGRR